jgi:hypothetical protein
LETQGRWTNLKYTHLVSSDHKFLVMCPIHSNEGSVMEC